MAPLPQQDEVTRVDVLVLLKQAPPEPALAVRLTRKLLGKPARPGLLHVTVTLAGEVTAMHSGIRGAGRETGAREGRHNSSVRVRWCRRQGGTRREAMIGEGQHGGRND